MTLIDAGPLVALIDRLDYDHHVCVEALSDLTGPLVTCFPVVTEAMYLLGRQSGWSAQDQLWTLIMRGEPEMLALDGSMLHRARELMEKYRDLPMDFADASLVALAEARDVRRVFTIDSDFRVYRFRGREHFDIVP